MPHPYSHAIIDSIIRMLMAFPFWLLQGNVNELITPTILLVDLDGKWIAEHSSVLRQQRQKLWDRWVNYVPKFGEVNDLQIKGIVALNARRDR